MTAPESEGLQDGEVRKIIWNHPRVSSGVDSARWWADRELWEPLTMPHIASWVEPRHVTSVGPVTEEPVPSPAERLAQIRDRFTDPRIIELRWSLNGDDVRFLLEQIDAAAPPSPVVPSVGAVPVEVPEDDCWFGDDPNTVGTAAARNRVWCVQCADWTDQAIAHDTEHRRITEGDLAGFAARVRVETFSTGQAALRDYADHLAGLGEPEPFVQGHRHAAVILAGVDGAYDLAEHDARVRADERQRIGQDIFDAIDVAYSRRLQLFGDEAPMAKAYLAGLARAGEVAERVTRPAAGSAVPVATPTEPAVKLTRDTLDGGWVAEFAPVPGCMSQGETIPEALRGLADALTETVAAIVDALDAPAEQDGQR